MIMKLILVCVLLVYWSVVRTDLFCSTNSTIVDSVDDMTCAYQPIVLEDIFVLGELSYESLSIITCEYRINTCRVQTDPLGVPEVITLSSQYIEPDSNQCNQAYTGCNNYPCYLNYDNDMHFQNYLEEDNYQCNSVGVGKIDRVITQYTIILKLAIIRNSLSILGKVINKVLFLRLINSTTVKLNVEYQYIPNLMTTYIRYTLDQYKNCIIDNQNLISCSTPYPILIKPVNVRSSSPIILGFESLYNQLLSTYSYIECLKFELELKIGLAIFEETKNVNDLNNFFPISSPYKFLPSDDKVNILFCTHSLSNYSIVKGYNYQVMLVTSNVVYCINVLNHLLEDCLYLGSDKWVSGIYNWNDTVKIDTSQDFIIILPKYKLINNNSFNLTAITHKIDSLLELQINAAISSRDDNPFNLPTSQELYIKENINQILPKSYTKLYNTLILATSILIIITVIASITVIVIHKRGLVKLKQMTLKIKNYLHNQYELQRRQ